MRELSFREVQFQSLGILLDIDAVCRANSIKYFIIFGTLIGAIRHGGFIPWDDDIDIGMTRGNYEKFLKCYKDEGKFRIVNQYTDNHCPFMISRISDDRFKLVSDYGPDYEIGIFVDVYPYDGVGNDENSIETIVRLSQRYSKGLSKSLEKNPMLSIKNLHKGIKKWLLLPMFPIAKLIGEKRYRVGLNKLAEMYPYDDSKFVGCVTWALIKRECFKKKWIEEIIDIEFEGQKVMAPRYYDDMLRTNFGDYMELPPEEDRIGHHFYRIYER